MRAHGASDVDGFGADDDSLGDEASARCLGADQWDTVGTSATHAYALRANPNRLIRSCQLCKNCGKEFTSWELFLQHGKCNSEDEGEEEKVDGLGFGVHHLLLRRRQRGGSDSGSCMVKRKAITSRL